MRTTLIILLALSTHLVACSDDSSVETETTSLGDSTDSQDSSDVDLGCGDLTGFYRLTGWTCDAVPASLEDFGVELTMVFSNATSGLWTMKFFTPPGQTASWVSRSSGRAASGTATTLTLSRAAPAEACSTSIATDTNWGPVETGVGQESCTSNSETPQSLEPVTYDCAVTATSLVMSSISEGVDGPCAVGQTSVQTWARF